MKKLSFFIALLLFISSALFAQVSINTDNRAPNNSAMIDVKSNSKGILNSDGLLTLRGSYGDYWSSITFDFYGYYLGFSSVLSTCDILYKARGHSLRCIRD